MATELASLALPPFSCKVSSTGEYFALMVGNSAKNSSGFTVTGNTVAPPSEWTRVHIVSDFGAETGGITLSTPSGSVHTGRSSVIYEGTINYVAIRTSGLTTGTTGFLKIEQL